MQLNLSEKNKSYIWIFIIAWFVYGFFSNTIGSCDMQMEMTEEGNYYVYYDDTDYDPNEIIIANSLTLFEAEEMIFDCIQDSKQIMKKYGTVYNLKTGNSAIDLLISIFILWLPVLLAFIIFKSELIK